MSDGETTSGSTSGTRVQPSGATDEKTYDNGHVYIVKNKFKDGKYSYVYEEVKEDDKGNVELYWA